MNSRRFTRSPRRRGQAALGHFESAALPHEAYCCFVQSTFMSWISQGLTAEPGEPPPITDVPLSSHTTNCPLVLLYQRMSLLLSPLKSPVSAIVQGLGAEPGEPPPI